METETELAEDLTEDCEATWWNQYLTLDSGVWIRSDTVRTLTP